MHKSEEKARAMLAGLSTKMLLEVWEQTTANNDENVPRVRGWIMEEVEHRNPEGFDEWLDSDEARDEDLRRYILGE